MSDPICLLCEKPFKGPVCDCVLRQAKPMDADARAAIERALKTGDFIFEPGWNAHAPEITQEDVIQMFRDEIAASKHPMGENP